MGLELAGPIKIAKDRANVASPAAVVNEFLLHVYQLDSLALFARLNLHEVDSRAQA